MSDDTSPSTQPAPLRKRRYGGENGYGHKENPALQNLIAEAPHVSELLAKMRTRVGAIKAATGARTKSLRMFGPTKVFDQGQTSSCVGHGLSGATMCSLGAAGTPLDQPLSMNMFYGLARCIDRANPSVALQDEGSDPNSGILGFATCGAIPMGPSVDGRYSDCDPSTINAEPKLGDLEEAATCKFKGAYQIPVSDFAALKTLIVQSIDAGFAINIATTVGENEEDWDPSKGDLGAFDPNDPTRGGHDIYIDGYEIDAEGNLTVLGANSWGEGWGLDGYFRGNEDFVRGWKMAFVIHLEKVAA